MLDADEQAERYEQRYCISLGSVPMHFIRRPVSIAPAEGTICFVDSGTRDRTGAQNSAGRFRDGKFQGVPFEPTHWTVPDDR
jgi:hypothetical protein